MRADRHLVRSPNYSEDDEAFLRAYTIPVEDWHWTTRAKRISGYRWFRSPNVIPIEKYRQHPPK
jgi:hypothetical protein